MGMSAAQPETMMQLRAQRSEDAAVLAGWTNQLGQAVSGEALPGDLALVLEDALSGRPLACLRLRWQLGLELPRYSFHLGCIVHAAAELQLFSAQQTLLLGNDHTGQSELLDLACAPALEPAAKRRALGLLVQHALQRWTDERPAGAQRLLVELGGQRDGQGRSPFWQALGSRFYRGDPAQAQARFGQAWCTHLAALLPRQPLYLSFLSDEARAALGCAGAQAALAEAVLRECGLRFSNHVRIDDGGPVMAISAA
jgi:arginine N-succinyltransferase